MQIWTVKDGKAYIITYGGVVNQFPDSLADAQKMIDSFEIGDLITNTDATTMVKSATTERDNASNITMSNITAEANIA